MAVVEREDSVSEREDSVSEREDSVSERSSHTRRGEVGVTLVVVAFDSFYKSEKDAFFS